MEARVRVCGGGGGGGRGQVVVMVLVRAKCERVKFEVAKLYLTQVATVGQSRGGGAASRTQQVSPVRPVDPQS